MKQTSSNLKDLLIPRQKFSAIFNCLTIHFIFILIHSFSSQTYILLMHKQQASLFVAYKGQLFFTNHCQKKNQNNQHSVHIKSALIINFTQSCIPAMISMIKPSFMFSSIVFSRQAQITFQFITC